MKVHISEIRKSPVNPKKDFTGKQLENLRESIRRYGFSASLVVCKDFDNKNKYICCDGNSRFAVIQEEEFGITEVDVVLNERIHSRQDLIDFIAIFDSIKKKYDFSMLNDVQKDMSEFSKNLLNVETKNKKYQVEVLQNTIIYMLTLPAETVKTFKRKFTASRIADQKLKEYVESLTDEEFLQIILLNYNEPKQAKKAQKKV